MEKWPMNLHDVIAKVCEHIKQGELVIFVGAGVSKDPPSCLPLGSELKNTPVEGLCASYPPDVKELIVKYAIADLSLEEVYGVIYDEIGDRLIVTMASVLDDDRLKPNSLHDFVARALSLGNIVVTTNYDRQIERAYYKEDLEICYNEYTFEKFVNTFPQRDRKWLLKLHGTFRVKEGNTIRKTFESIRATLDLVGSGLPSKTEEALRVVLKECPILFMGYGCGDVDIVYPVLARVKSGKELWWVKHDDEKLLHLCMDIQNLKRELPHITNVLLNRGKSNDGKVFLIRYPTREFIKELATNLGWEFAPTESDGFSESHWKEKLFNLGYQTNHVEKASILATLARFGIDTEKGSENKEQLIKLMEKLYREAIQVSKEPLKTARLYRGLGFSIYLQDPTSPEIAEKAIEYYRIAEELLEKVAPEKKPPLEKAELLSLRALAYRRSYQIRKALKFSICAWEAIPEQILDQLEKLCESSEAIRYKGQELSDRAKSDLGNILRRIANIWYALVSDPATLSTSIRGFSWEMHPSEEKLLRKALKLASMYQRLQRGKIRERIQSENILGLIATKLGEVDKAKKVHKKSKENAFLLNWIGREYAQACRNLGLALEKEGDLEKAIIELEKALEKFARKGDRLTTTWHVGRVLIKKGDSRGISTIEEVEKQRKLGDWHITCNDLVLLGIGYYDLEKDKHKAEDFFKRMLEIYEGIKDDRIASMPYGTDNALANIKSAYFRLCPAGKHRNDNLCERFRRQQERLERMRREKIRLIEQFLK